MALRVNRMDVENQNNVAGKGVVTRGVVQRTALGDIQNKFTRHSVSMKPAPQKQAVETTRISRSTSLAYREIKKPAVPRTGTNLTRATSLVSLQKKDALLCTKVEPKSLQYGTPIPMDISELVDSFSTQLLPSHIENIDAEDEENPQLVSEYASDIFSYLRFLENHYALSENFMKGQREVSPKMRSILIDWLVQVHQRFHLLQETLFLTVACLDRYLQEQQVSKTQLQLVGVTAMYVACKYEEMYAPEVNDFVYITDNAYSKQGILKMEQSMLKVLRFGLGRPLPLHFLRRNSKAGNVDGVSHTVAKYAMELTITEAEFSHWPPSRMAAAALCLAQRVMARENWSPQLAFYSGYSEKDIMPSVGLLANLVVKAPSGKLQAVRTKFSSAKFYKVAVQPQLNSATMKELAALVKSS